MNRTVWKYLAAVSMLLDHIGYFFLPENSWGYVLCRTLGRIAAPTMCYLLAEGYQYTRSRGKYALRLLIFGVLTQPIFGYAFYENVWAWNGNMMLTLLLSFLALWFFEGGPIPANKTLMVGALVLLSSLGDWGVMAPVWVLLFYYAREDRKKQERIFLISALIFVGITVLYNFSVSLPWYQDLFQAGILLFLPLLHVYNGEKGSSHWFHKWFFYGFYPLHLLLLGWFAL